MNAQPTATEPDDGARNSWSEDRLPPPSSFFPSIAYDEVLERVHRLVENAKEVALLTGPDGAGKTTLLFRIQSDTPEHWLTCRVDANPMMHPDQLFTRLVRCLGIAEEGEEPSATVTAAFAEFRTQGVLPVVMVDDAEQLPLSTMVALLRLHESRAAGKSICSLLFLARPDIQSALSTEQIHAMGTDRFERIELPRLGLEEVPQYLRHFLRMEGVDQEFALDTDELIVLHKKSGGLPGQLNELVVHSMRDAVHTRKEPIPVWLLSRLRSLPPITAMASGVLVFLFILTLVFESQLEILFQPDAASTGVDPVPAEVQEPEQAEEEGKGIRVKPLLVPPVSEPLYEEPKEAAPLEAEPLEAEPETQPAPPIQVVEPELPEEESTTNQELPEQPKETPPTSPESKPESEGANTPVFKREAWLLKQRPDSYSLQILAAGSEDAVRRFAEKHDLNTDIYYYKSQRNERPWIVLLFGIYEDRRTAVTVLNMLPEALREAGAWPRSFRSIQEEIKRAR